MQQQKLQKLGCRSPLAEQDCQAPGHCGHSADQGASADQLPGLQPLGPQRPGPGCAPGILERMTAHFTT